VALVLSNLKAPPDVSFSLINIAKTHRVVYQNLFSKADMQKNIESSARLGPVDLLILYFHGCDHSLTLQEEKYEVSDVRPEEFASLAPSGTIILYSCRTGNGLAQRIADVSRRMVFAPMENLLPYHSCVSICPIHHRYEMQSWSGGKAMTFEFSKNRPPECCESLQTTDRYFYERDLFFQEDLSLAPLEWVNQLMLAACKRDNGSLLQAIIDSPHFDLVDLSIPFPVAAAKGHLDCMTALLFSRRAHQLPYGAALYQAAQLGELSCLDTLLNFLSKQGWFVFIPIVEIQEAVLVAASKGHFDCFKSLITALKNIGRLDELSIDLSKVAPEYREFFSILSGR
jgi:hypothetical protein